MPVETVGFHLKPVGFFKHNPALDLPRTVNTASKLVSSCCATANGHVRPIALLLTPLNTPAVAQGFL